MPNQGSDCKHGGYHSNRPAKEAAVEGGWNRCASSRLWVLVVVFAAGVCYPSIKAGLPSAPPLRFAGLRTLIGGILLLANTEHNNEYDKKRQRPGLWDGHSTGKGRWHPGIPRQNILLLQRALPGKISG